MIQKLRRKFVLVTMAIVTGMLVIIFFLVYNFTAWNLNSQADNLLETLLAGPQPVKTALPYFTVSANSWGALRVEGTTDFDIENETLVQALLDAVRASDRKSGVLEGYNLRYRVRLGHTDWKVAFVDISSHESTLWGLVQISLLIGILSILAFWGIAVLLAKWAVAPVETAWQQQKQFISDASHELKTPLTVIMSNAELLQDESLENTDRSRYCGNILTVSKQMRHLVDGMLELARADNGKTKIFFQPLNFSNLISQAVLPFEPVLYERQLILETEITPDISLTGSESHLRQVVEILLDNAAKYATAGIVDVTLSQQGRYALLSVASPGAPIPSEDRKRIFERFYRVDAARQRNGSFGLGLSIARSIVTDHGGKIWVDSNESGNCFFVQLPL